MDALWGKSGSAFGQVDAAARTDRARESSAGPSIAAATSAGRKIQVERSAALKAFHDFEASERAKTAPLPPQISSEWRAKIPTRKKAAPPPIPKGKVKRHPSVPHDQDDAHDELDALKTLKADYSAKTAAARADADYSKLVSVQEQVAALRAELDVRTELEEAEALLAVQDPWQVDNVYQLVDAEGNDVSRQAAESAGAAVSRPRQQSATRAHRNRSRSASLRQAAQAAQAAESSAAAVSRPRQQSATRAHRNRSRSRSTSLTAPPPVIADEHIPHVAVRISTLLRLHCGSWLVWCECVVAHRSVEGWMAARQCTRSRPKRSQMEFFFTLTKILMALRCS